MASSSPVTILRAGPDDAERLAALARSTFVDTFGADNDPADMATYCAQAFGVERQRAELRDVHVTVFLAQRAGAPVGYAMLREGAAPAEAPAGALEIARLYSVREAVGTGVGAALMRACLDEAAARGHRAVWLGVWERNARAIAFYRGWGFEDVGMHQFQLGADRQVDRVMVRAVGAGEGR